MTVPGFTSAPARSTTFDLAGGRGGNPPDVLGHQGSRAPDFAHHGPALHRARVDGAARHGRGGRLQLGDCDGQADHRRDRDDTPNDAIPLFSLQNRRVALNIHCH